MMAFHYTGTTDRTQSFKFFTNHADMKSTRAKGLVRTGGRAKKPVQDDRHGEEMGMEMNPDEIEL